jgi:threonine synthase
VAWRGVIEEYRSFLPVDEQTPVVTLLEGNTALIPAGRLAEAAEIPGRLYLKYEGQNPTGSFKDRGMTMAVSKAVEQGARAIMCASTGNTSASAAAYAAKAGVSAIVLIPEGAIAMGKLSQAVMHGSRVLAVRGNFDDALILVRRLTETHPIALVNSINPFRIEGQKTAAFEICDALGHAPDILAIPVGNAGNITAYWKGFGEYHRAGKASGLPRMFGFQAAGAAPIVRGEPVANPDTLATAIRIGNPASWEKAVAARDESGGLIEAVTDAQIVEAYKLLARHEGVFCEPASAASVAGIIQLARQGRLSGEPTIVCVLTGHGLKDPDCAIAASGRPEVVDATMAAVESTIMAGLER